MDLAERLKTSRLVAQLLLNRGVTDPTDAQAFLRPTLKTLHDPALIPGLTVAAERVARAIRDHEKIAIYGDYDVDGITATAILWHALRRLGGDVISYIPHRVEEGYGLNTEAIVGLCEQGIQLIITVDCGITAIDPIAAARERGVDVVVTDHHEWKEQQGVESATASHSHRVIEVQDSLVAGVNPRTPAKATTDDIASSLTPSAPVYTGDQGPLVPLLPDTPYIAHPRLPGGNYPNPHLCGAGVAFKLAWGVGQAVAGGGRVPPALKDFLVEATALAALGTIADVVPLVGENRVLAHFGLGGLKESKLTGVRALIESADLGGRKLDSYHVGFLLAPRLNAAGRMGHARLAVEMLTSADETKAFEIATYLEQQNKHRQQTERGILDAALEQIDTLKLAESRAIVVGDIGWHPGVIGIVASRIVDRFHRPAIVIAMDAPDAGGLGHGSGRSIDGFHLSKALVACGHLLESHGGHEMAAGLKVKGENFAAFRDAFAAHALESIDEAMLVPELRVDSDAELAGIDEALVNDLARLGPFGRGNPKPLLRCRDVVLTAPPKRIGKTCDHLVLAVRTKNMVRGGKPMKAIAFGAADWADKLSEGDTVHLCVQPQINEFNGWRSVELEVKDLQLAK